MADLKDLDTKFEGYATAVTGINGYIFDDLSAVNKMKGNQYPLLMLNPPVSSIPNIANIEEEDYVIVFYVFDLYKVAEINAGTGLSEKWSTLHDLGRKVLQLLNLEKPDIGIISNIPMNIERGHRLHNSKYVAVRYTLTVRAFDCLV